MTAPKEKLRLLGDHLQQNPRRKYGPGTSGSLVECPKHMEFYDSHESCPTCLSWSETVDKAVDELLKEPVGQAEPDDSEEDTLVWKSYWP